jgi:hypothetical protein
MKDNDLQQDIIGLYDNNLKNVFSINQIASLLKKKYPYINKKVTGMIDEGILKKLEIGRSYLCSLNLKNEKTLLLLAFNEMHKKKGLQELGKIEETLENLKKEVIIFSAVGVHKNSRIQELYIISPSKKAIKAPFKTIFVDENRIKEMLADKDCLLFKSHIVFYGAEKFFEYILETEERLQKLYSPLAAL